MIELVQHSEKKHGNPSLTFKDIKPVNVRVRNLSVSAKPKKKLGFLGSRKQVLPDLEKNPQLKPILSSTSFDLPSGSLMAIIGGSGSGKTTLLNVLANRSSSSSLVTTGEISFNGSDLSRVRNAYVIQQDILSPNLTTRETLIFATELRLPDSTTKQERLMLVEEIIMELGLRDCADTIVGDSVRKGLSGGEKRRLSIGIQMLSNPSLLFLDEPTTGLDAHSAFLVIQTLKGLARRGRTIIISIHQPRSDIFFLFDYLCILSKGKTVYSYKVKGAVLEYFEALGYFVPENVNPADFLIDITTVDVRTQEAEETGLINLDEFDRQWKKFQAIPGTLNDSDDLYSKDSSGELEPVTITKAPFWREVIVLTKRTTLLTIRDTATLLSLILESIFMGIICGWVFYKPNNDLSGIRSTISALYVANGLQGYLMLLFEVYRLTASDIKLFDRERADNCTSILGFLLSRRLAKLFTEDVIVTVIYACITYFMFGLQVQTQKFFIYWTAIFLIHLCSMTGGMFAVAVSRNFAASSLIANMNYTLQSFACGYFANAKRLPVYVRWTKYIAYIWFGFGSMLSNQFTGYFGDCPYGSINDESCQAYSGIYIIKSYGFWENWIGIPLIAILGWVLGFYIAAGVLFHFKKVDISLSKQLKFVRNYEERAKLNVNDKKDVFRDDLIDLNVENICLSVKVKRNRKKIDKLILDNVSAKFMGGKINAIMGPSGSGKSSLLNLISGRLGSDLVNRYSTSGDVFFDGLKIQTKMTNTICSYVSQDDDHLLSTLSVRETLDLAADLRIGHLSKNDRKLTVDELIGKLGLKSCSNTLIGSEFIKGISGGEKRRVSMAIQLLNNPKILLLDEPTSGLDSFTASSILEILQTLADEGKTIILTIHQPRSDLFTKFGQVLLLAKGGAVGYNGAQNQMIRYFEDLGYPCDKLTNSADHVLDLISVNNQSFEQDIISKARIQKLLSNWKETLIESRFDNTKPLNESEFDARFGKFARKPAPFIVAFYSCSKQLMLTFWRNKEVFFARITNILGLGIILTLYMAPLRYDYGSIQDRLGLIQQLTALYFCGMLNNLSAYPAARDYFYHEYHDNVYGVLPFFLSYTALELPFEIVASLLFSILSVFACGLPKTPEVLFSFFYVCMMIVFCGESLGIMTNTIFKHAGFAVNTVSIVLSIGTFMAGIMSLQMDKVLKGFNYLSPLNYGLSICLNVGFPADLKFTCDDSTRNSDGTCIFSNGTDVLTQYGLKNDNYKNYFGVLLCVAVIYRLIAYGLLRLKLLKIDLGVFKSNYKNAT